MDGRIALPKGYRAWECSSGGASRGEVRFPLRQQRGGTVPFTPAEGRLWRGDVFRRHGAAFQTCVGVRGCVGGMRGMCPLRRRARGGDEENVPLI